MPTKSFANKSLNEDRLLDARADRPDVRDRVYSPPLRRLPDQYPSQEEIDLYFPRYQKDGMVLDQGSEGACTGFGLSAVVNYLLWRDALAANMAPRKVSARMLYHLARVYDEWPGEDYNGSSCRGAMKGWFHHGVCDDSLWPYRDPKTGQVQFISPFKGWDDDAAGRRLGSYYRIDKMAIADMQAAIKEVGAIYASAGVHDGWNIAAHKKLTSLKWTARTVQSGMHAFALVGYDTVGFIVQNSWGAKWGFHGFARIAYEDWLANGADAWVATMGARAPIKSPSMMLSTNRTVPAAMRKMGQATGLAAASDAVPLTANFSPELIEQHALVLGNNGRPDTISIVHEDAASFARSVCFTRPKQWFEDNKPKKRRIAVYCHGGLNDLAEGLTRTSIMAPCFRDNEIYPIFAVWQSGPGETIRSVLEDKFAFEAAKVGPSGSFFEKLKEQATDVSDSVLETTIARPFVRPLWTEMKQNAEAASEAGGAMNILAESLAELNKDPAGIELHLIGHSAGAVMIGRLLELLTRKKIAVQSCTLYAPACTVAFAVKHYGDAVAAGTLNKNNFAIEILNNERERADGVGPYRKSLLYLISRALEIDHKTPLLGMEPVWNDEFDEEDVFRSSANAPKVNPKVAEWRDLWFKQWKLPKPAVMADKKVTDGVENIDVKHGCFDNAIVVVTRTIELILGGKLKKKISSLHGF